MSLWIDTVIPELLFLLLRVHLMIYTNLNKTVYMFESKLITCYKIQNQWNISGLNIDWCKAPDVGLPKPDKVFFLTMPLESVQQRKGYGNERLVSYSIISINFYVMINSIWYYKLKENHFFVDMKSLHSRRELQICI